MRRCAHWDASIQQEVLARITAMLSVGDLTGAIGGFYAWRGVVAQLAEATSRADVERLREQGKLLACRSRGGWWLYPAFQFRDNEVVKGLPETLEAIGPNVDGWQVALWMTRPSDDLGGRRPIEALWDGDIEDVLALARTEGPTLDKDAPRTVRFAAEAYRRRL